MDKSANTINLIFTEQEWQGLIKKLAFSPRQADVVKCLFSGHSDKQIANFLNISLPTVRTHLSRLFLKYDAQDREELILLVFGAFREDCDRKKCPRLH